MFDAVIAPAAKRMGLEFTYDEMRAAALDGRELTDDELEMVAGGTGMFYRKLISGALAATMVFASIPAYAFGEESGSSSSSAQVELVDDQQEDGQQEDGQQVSSTQEQIALVEAYTPSFTLEDIATPQGLTVTEEGVFLDDSASAVVAESAKETGSIINMENAEKAIDYTRKALGFVDEDAAKVADYGKAIFNLVKAGANFDFGDLADNGVDQLKMMGIIEGDEEEPTVSNKEIYEEIQGLRDLCAGMNKKIDLIAEESLKGRFQNVGTINIVLNSDCGSAEKMFARADQIARERSFEVMSDKAELPAAPEFPAYPPETLVEPTLELPAEPQPELPAEPTLELTAEPKHPSDFTADGRWASEGETWDEQADDWYRRYGIDQCNYTIDYQVRCMMYDQAHAAWEAECEQLKAAYEQAHAEWQAECDSILGSAEWQQTHGDWQAECDRLTAEYEQAHATWEAEHESYDFNAAVAKWQATCDQMAADYNAQCEAALKEHAEKYAEFSRNYTRELAKIINEGADANMEGFENAKLLMNRIEENFNTLAAECSKDEDVSPLSAYDAYVNLQFNWESQGYYLRQAYRSNSLFTLKRAYTLLSAYYGLIGNPNATRTSITDMMEAALKGIEKNDAGMSPDDVIANARRNSSNKGERAGYREREIDVFCFAFDKRVGYMTAEHGYPSAWQVTDAQIWDYIKRLHGRSVKEDLELAGITEADSISYGWGVQSGGITKPADAAGIAFNVVAKDGTYTADKLLKWDGTMDSLVVTYRQGMAEQLCNYLIFH